jgi:hypothetical protein
METHDPAPVLEWSVRPVSRQRVKGISAVAVIMASIYAAFLWGGPVLGFLSVLVLVGGTGSFFTTTRYRLTPETVSVRSPFKRVSRPWGEYHRAYLETQGVSLSPFRNRHVLEPYRSVMLQFGDRREAVLDMVRRFGPEIRSPGGTQGESDDPDRG